MKTSPDALEGGYETEAAGLAGWPSRGRCACPRCWPWAPAIPRCWRWSGSTRRARPDHAEQLGAVLAATARRRRRRVRRRAARHPRRGAAPLRLGPLEIPNEPAEDWATFYADSRLRPLADRAEERDALPDGGRDAIERLCERMAEFAGPAEPPARLHGDLWSGNVMTDAAGPPCWWTPPPTAATARSTWRCWSCSARPGERFTAAYEEAHPLAEGHADRTALWQVFPLLVHAALFGGGYGARAVQAARRYVG